MFANKTAITFSNKMTEGWVHSKRRGSGSFLGHSLEGQTNGSLCDRIRINTMIRKEKPYFDKFV